MTTSAPPIASLTATLIGGPTLHFGYAGRAFLTDPTFDPPGSYQAHGITLTKLAGPAVGAEALGPVDVVLLSHDQHADNLDRAGREYLRRVPVTLTTESAAGRLPLPGVKGLEPWQVLRLEPAADPGTPGHPADPVIVVTAVPALHGPPGCEPVSGQVIGFVLEAENWPTVYVSGDNAAVDVLAEITGRFPRIDVAVLFVGAANVGRFGASNVTLGSAEAAAVAELLPRAVVLPVHAEDWAHFTEPLSAFEQAYQDTPTEHPRLLSLPRGKAVQIDPESANPR
jgi:L-ascorbate metabolism protein UlaG (beta-lactamase superfamily)